MRKFKNLRGYRQKPTIYGLNTTGFIVTSIISILSLLTFLSGVSVKKIFIVLSLVIATFLISLLLSKKEIIESLFDETLPKRFSDDE